MLRSYTLGALGLSVFAVGIVVHAYRYNIDRHNQAMMAMATLSPRVTLPFYELSYSHIYPELAEVERMSYVYKP